MRRVLIAFLFAAASAGLSFGSAQAGDLDGLFDEYTGTLILAEPNGMPVEVINPERGTVRQAPNSTFKIANSLIALDMGIAPNADFELEWDGTEHPREALNRDHDLRSAYKNSVVWYYQEIARRVGPDRMKKYLNGFSYGNMDISDGIDRFWLEGSLKISPEEQVAFLSQLYYGTLPVTPEAIQTVKDIMVDVTTSDGTVIRAKTGTGGVPDADEASGYRAIRGWYVGWIEPAGGTPRLFATNIEGDGASGAKARNITLEALRALDLLDD